MHINHLLRDESWPTWRSMAHRMSTWVPLIHGKDGHFISGIATSMLNKAAGDLTALESPFRQPRGGFVTSPDRGLGCPTLCVQQHCHLTL